MGDYPALHHKWSNDRSSAIYMSRDTIKDNLKVIHALCEFSRRQIGDILPIPENSPRHTIGEDLERVEFTLYLYKAYSVLISL